MLSQRKDGKVFFLREKWTHLKVWEILAESDDLGKIKDVPLAWHAPLICQVLAPLSPCRSSRGATMLEAEGIETKKLRRFYDMCLLLVWICLDFGMFRKCLRFWLCQFILVNALYSDSWISDFFGEFAGIFLWRNWLGVQDWGWCICVSSQGNMFAWGCTLLHPGFCTTPVKGVVIAIW